MKTNILIALSVLSLISCEVQKSNEVAVNSTNLTHTTEVTNTDPIPEKAKNRVFTDFIYDVGPRFNEIKKNDLDKITSFNDLIAEEFANRIVLYKSVSLTYLNGEEETVTKATGTDGTFTAEQLALIKAAELSTNLLFRAEYREHSFHNGELEDSVWTPYMTVVPEKQARYTFGKDVLKEFLKIKSEESRKDVDPEKLRPAKLFFTVTKTGGIENVTLDRPSGYEEVDETMIKLIKETANAWEPAENAKGEKVDQELVVSFGLMGC